MLQPTRTAARSLASAAGYTMIEALVSIAIMALISGTMLDGVLRFTRTNGTISNRTEMHSSVRNATALLQQEVGQAGRIALPAAATLSGAVAAGTATVTLNSVAGMFVGERLVVDTGVNEETITVTVIDTVNRRITALFAAAHAAGAPVAVYGGFAAGVVPTTTVNGSTGTVLKIFGDVNGNGSMVYVEYFCDTAGGNLYRRSMAFNAVAKVALTPDMALLNNITANPDGTPCFTYQQKTAGGVPYVVNVAITLTVQTAEKDPQTGLFQKETKALLNVAPRNVFNVWQLAGLGIVNRIQPTPATVTALLP